MSESDKTAVEKQPFRCGGCANFLFWVGKTVCMEGLLKYKRVKWRFLLEADNIRADNLPASRQQEEVRPDLLSCSLIRRCCCRLSKFSQEFENISKLESANLRHVVKKLITCVKENSFEKFSEWKSIALPAPVVSDKVFPHQWIRMWSGSLEVLGLSWHRTVGF